MFEKMMFIKMLILLSIIIGPAILGFYSGFKPSPSNTINDVILIIGVSTPIVISFTIFHYIGVGLSYIVRSFFV
jgi:hypothetical protein